MNPYLETIKKIQERAATKSNTTAEIEPPLRQYQLDVLDCPECQNVGYIWWRDDAGIVHSRECSCMPRRRAIRRLESAGLGSMGRRYRLDNFMTPTEKHKQLLRKAREFTVSSTPAFVICGQPGSGKSHLTCAIAAELIMRGYDVRYWLWRRDGTLLKALITSAPKEYEARLNALINTPVLLIDDFWKGSITPADVNLAFTIIDGRYNRSDSRTIISTELSIERILEVDEATGSRLREMARGYLLCAPDINWRLAPAG